MLLHFSGFKPGKRIIFIISRTISGHSQITDDHRKASAPLCVGRQIFSLLSGFEHWTTNAWFQAWVFFYLTYFFLGILLLYVRPILYDLFPIFLLHFWRFKLGKFFVFIMFRTISGCSQIIVDNRLASASSLRSWQIFFPLLSNQRKNCFLVTITYSVQVHSFSSISVKLIFKINSDSHS